MTDARNVDTNRRPLKLHLGGWQVKEGWTIVNVEDRAGVGQGGLLGRGEGGSGAVHPPIILVSCQGSNVV